MVGSADKSRLPDVISLIWSGRLMDWGRTRRRLQAEELKEISLFELVIHYRRLEGPDTLLLDLVVWTCSQIVRIKRIVISNVLRNMPKINMLPTDPGTGR